MGEDSRKIEVCLLGVGGAWLVGLALLAWVTFGGPDIASRWALYLSAVAASWTVVIALNRCRHRLLMSFVRELALIDRREDEGLRSL